MTVYVSAMDLDAGTATLAVILWVDGIVTTPSAYQWAHNGTAISGATGATLAITSKADIDGLYSCTVDF